jgi:hypothetical protein
MIQLIEAFIPVAFEYAYYVFLMTLGSLIAWRVG